MFLFDKAYNQEYYNMLFYVGAYSLCSFRFYYKLHAIELL